MRSNALLLLPLLTVLLAGCPWNLPTSVPPELETVRASIEPQPNGKGALETVIPGEVLEPLRNIDGCWGRHREESLEGTDGRLVEVEEVTYLEIAFAERRIKRYDMGLQGPFRSGFGIAEGTFELIRDGRIRLHFERAAGSCMNEDLSEVSFCAEGQLYRLGALEPVDYLITVEDDALKILPTERGIDRSDYFEEGLEEVNKFSEAYTRLDCP